jgi:hypothetical protein
MNVDGSADRYEARVASVPLGPAEASLANELQDERPSQ